MAKPHELTKAQYKDEIISLYQSGINTTELARKFSVQPAAIRYILKQNGIGLRGRDPLLLVGKGEEIAKMYSKGDTIPVIAQRFGVAVMTVWHSLKSMGVDCRDSSHRKRKYNIKEHYFEAIDTENKAYYLGFLYADGNNFTAKNMVSMQLQERDKCVLEGLRKCLGYDGPISSQTRKTAIGNTSYQCKLQIKNKKLSESLSKWGMKSGKTYDLDFPDWIDENLMPHFLRGFMDGDGWITYSYASNSTTAYQCQVGFIGFIRFIESLQSYLQNKLGINTPLRVAKKNGNPDIVKIETHTRQDAIKLCNYLYSGATVFLARKREKFDSIVRIESSYSDFIRGSSRLSKSMVLTVKKQLIENINPSDIAEINNISLDSVCSIRSGRSWGNVTGKEKHVAKKMLNREQIAEILRLVDIGTSPRKIAVQFGIARTTIYNLKNGTYRSEITGRGAK